MTELEVCHNCGDEMPKLRIHNRNENIPRFCTKIECRKERYRYSHQVWSAAKRAKEPNKKRGTGICAKCGAPMMKRKLAAWCNECRASAGAGLRESGKGMPRDCHRCKYNSNCAERVKIGLWVVCERIDERDIEAAQISPHYDRMVELIAEARAM